VQQAKSSTVLDQVQRMSEGHEFTRYDGMSSWWPAAEHRCHLCAISETGTQSAAMFQPIYGDWM